MTNSIQSLFRTKENPVDGYIDRVAILESAVTDNDALKRELGRQSWALQAVLDAENEPAIRATAQRLLNLVQHEDSSATEIREACKSFVKECADVRATARSKSREVERLTALSAGAGLLGTIVAILFGKQGLIPFFESLRPSNPHVAAPDLRFDKFDLYLAILHTLMISLFLVLRFSPFGSPSAAVPPKSELAKKSYEQFLRGWTAIWLSWLLLYSWLSVAWGFELSQQSSPIHPSLVWALADLFNVASAVAFLYLFLVMDIPSVPSKKDPERSRHFRISFAFVMGVGAAVYIPAVLGRCHLLGLGQSGPTIVSLFAAVAMAYFFGRLDSFHMSVARWALFPLYLYVAIQVIWVNFGDPERAQPARGVFLCLALLLKVYMFVAVTHWLLHGNIQRYLEFKSTLLAEDAAKASTMPSAPVVQ
jgi:hypothetical protein